MWMRRGLLIVVGAVLLVAMAIPESPVITTTWTVTVHLEPGAPSHEVEGRLRALGSLSAPVFRAGEAGPTKADDVYSTVTAELRTLNCDDTDPIRDLPGVMLVQVEDLTQTDAMMRAYCIW